MCIFVCVHVCLYVSCMYVCMWLCLYVCVCVCLHVCIHVHVQCMCNCSVVYMCCSDSNTQSQQLQAIPFNNHARGMEVEPPGKFPLDN